MQVQLRGSVAQVRQFKAAAPRLAPTSKTPACASSSAAFSGAVRLSDTCWNHLKAGVIVRAAEVAVSTETEAATLVELNQKNFWEFLEANQHQLVVVDFYTTWCGPCKMILPELVKMNAEYQAAGTAQIVKLNCNKDNKDLGKELNIKVAPTFQLYRGRNKVGEMTGAKVEKLRELIESQL